MNPQNPNPDIYFNSIDYFQKLEKALAQKLGLEEFRSGGHTIRNEKGWRENEKSIEYIWVAQINRAFGPWGGVFSIKYNENKFREHANKEELVQGIYLSNEHGIDEFYCQTLPDTTKDKIAALKFNLFLASTGITLDGVSYNLRISAASINSFIQLNNPTTAEWKIREQELWILGNELAKNSNNETLIKLFA
jgi:hypothetical protein